MREFIVFARFLNFSRAATYLNVSQPTLSSHVAGMERELGFQLVERTRPLRLTPAGKRFYREAEQFLSSLDTTVESCRELSKKNTGTLTFELPISQGGVREELNLLLLLFKKRFPTISVYEHDGSDLPLREVLKSGQADAGFFFNPEVEGADWDLAGECELLAAPDRERGPYYLWVDASHPLAARRRLALEDLAGCRFLIPSNIRYQGLERLASSSEDARGIPVSWVFWPGDYEECILNIGPSEVMIINEADTANPAYGLVEGRSLLPLEGFERLMRPCFVFLKENKNPALNALRTFMGELAPSAALWPRP